MNTHTYIRTLLLTLALLTMGACNGVTTTSTHTVGHTYIVGTIAWNDQDGDYTCSQHGGSVAVLDSTNQDALRSLGDALGNALAPDTQILVQDGAVYRDVVTWDTSDPTMTHFYVCDIPQH